MGEWQEGKLEDCLECLIDYRGKSPTKSPTGIPVLSAKVVKTAGLLHPIEQTISEEYYPQWMVRGFPRVGDIILTTEGPMGEVIQLDEQTATYALGQRIVCLRAKQDVLDNGFLRYLLISPRQQDILTSFATGTTVLGVSQKALRSVPIRFPPLPEQRAIAAVLSALDDKIALNRRMNETLEGLARALFKDWFVDFGPTRAKMALSGTENGRGAKNTQTSTDPTLAPEIRSLFPDRLDDKGKPEGWEEKPLDEFFSILGGGTPKTKEPAYWGGNIPWYSVVDAPDGSDVFVHDTEKKITERGLQESSAKLVRVGTTIISARGTVGKLAMAAQEMTFNQSCYGLQGAGPAGDCFTYLAAQHMVLQLQAMAHGSVFSTITRSTFGSLKLAMPPLCVFDAFEKAALPLFEKMKANGKESRTLAQTRDLLLPKLMSGQLRVGEAEGIVEGAM